MNQIFTLKDGTEFEVEIDPSNNKGLKQASGKSAKKRLSEVMVIVEGVASEMSEGLQNMSKSADAIELELYLKFGGKTGVIFASGSAECGVTLKMKWEK